MENGRGKGRAAVREEKGRVREWMGRWKGYRGARIAGMNSERAGVGEANVRLWKRYSMKVAI